jgi:hypothetical protein
MPMQIRTLKELDAEALPPPWGQVFFTAVGFHRVLGYNVEERISMGKRLEAK